MIIECDIDDIKIKFITIILFGVTNTCKRND
jgi:hypothetical protein